MNKLILNKKEAQAIEGARFLWDDEKIIEICVKEDSTWMNECAPLNDMSLLRIAGALINVYEVKKTPEEQLRDYYEEHRLMNLPEDTNQGQFNVAIGRKDGVIKTLHTLGIEIEGINK